MDLKSANKVLERFEGALQHKYAKRSIWGTLLVLYFTFQTEVNAGFSYLSKVPALLKMEETVLQKEMEFKEANKELSIKINRQEAQIDSLTKGMVDISFRIDESNNILVEELDHKDTLGESLEMTNPGNLYKYLKFDFYRATYDKKYRTWEY